MENPCSAHFRSHDLPISRSPVKFSVIIPARYASTRFPGKPLADVGGKPMVVRVAERAARSGADEVLIATDDARIARAAAQHGFKAVMTRGSHVSGTDRIAEVAAKRRFSGARIVVNVQGDEPLIAPALIRRVAAGLARHRAAAMATACHPITDARELADPNAVKVALDRAGYALYFSRAPIPFARDAFARGISRVPPRLPAYRHLGIYAYRAGFLRVFTRLAPAAIERFEALEQLRALAHGYRIHCAIVRAAPPPGVDTPADLRRLLRKSK
ncbi:MAG: 3-deoxy-manno-octulosonate cytidylyltransferase [Betaproteobacteria bacterium]|nr:3-deoxy-manno-octulosonate cytidylyltransferase [Betaproteobacteria bacterium]